MKRYIIILFASLMAIATTAQELTEQQKIEFRQKAFDLIITYSKTSSLSDDESKEAFTGLFAEPSMQIYNDLMGFTGMNEISVEDYVNTLSYKTEQLRSTIYNIRQGEVFIDEETWQMPVEFEKEISYSTIEDGTFLNSHEYYGALYKMKMQIVMDIPTERCYIGALEGDIESNVPRLTGSYTVLESRNRNQDNALTINGSPVKFNGYNQMIIPGELDKNQIHYTGADDFRLVKDKSNNGVTIMHIDYVPKPFRIMLQGSYGFNYYGAPKNFDTHNSHDINFGLDLGYVFLTKTKWTVGAFVGLGLSMSHLELGLSNMLSFTDLNPEEDADGDEYERKYEGASGFKQNMNLKTLTVPIYLDMEYRFNPNLSVYVDLGVKLLSVMGSSMKSDSVKIGRVYGHYEKYGLDIPSEDDTSLTFEGFGKNKRSIGHNEYKDLKFQFGLSVLMGVGLRYNFSKVIGAELGIQYSLGVLPVWHKDNPITIEEDKTSDTLLKYSNGKEMDVPLLNAVKDLKAGGLRAQIGVIYTF